MLTHSNYKPIQIYESVCVNSKNAPVTQFG